MLYKTMRAIIFRGDRVEKGREIDLSEEDAARLGDDVTPAVADAAPAEPEPEVALEDMTLKQLKAKAEALGLSTEGTKADLLERIKLHQPE